MDLDKQNLGDGTQLRKIHLDILHHRVAYLLFSIISFASIFHPVYRIHSWSNVLHQVRTQAKVHYIGLEWL